VTKTKDAHEAAVEQYHSDMEELNRIFSFFGFISATVASTVENNGKENDVTAGVSPKRSTDRELGDTNNNSQKKRPKQGSGAQGYPIILE
jgi:hypothetical protein